MEVCTTAIPNSVILYRAGRLRFIIGALLFLPCTVLIAALAYDGIYLGDSQVRGVWATIPLGAVFILLDYIAIVKLVRPPKLEISLQGIRWANAALRQQETSYDWQDFDGPTEATGDRGVPLLQIVIKSTGRKLSFAPSQFGATYEEMAAIISAARAGNLIPPEAWRSEHPGHRFRQWMLNFGLPVALGLLLAMALIWFQNYR